MVYGPCGRVASGDSSVTGSLTDKCKIYSIPNDTVDRLTIGHHLGGNINHM